MSRFGAATTADQVLEGVDLDGRLMLVTGASAGLGIEAARALAAHGAHVVMAVRDLEKGERAASQILESCRDARLELGRLDLTSLASVRGFTHWFLARHQRLDVLIANAGIMGTPFGRTSDGFELQFGTNHLGHFLLVNRLVPVLVATAPSRVVVVSSFGHRWADVDLEDPDYREAPYRKFEAYGRSKTANVLFAVELDKRLAASGVRAFALHPGGIPTELGRHFTEHDRQELMELARRSRGEAAPAYKSLSQGAATTVYAAASDELDGLGGCYLEDCAVAGVTGSEATFGVREYAVDADRAGELWSLSERLVGERFNFASTTGALTHGYRGG